MMRSPAFSISLPTYPAPRLTRPVEGLLLDACDTLYDATGWRRWLLKVLRRLGIHTSYKGLFHVWEKDYLDAVQRGERPFCDALAAFLQAVGLSRSQIAEVSTTCRQRRIRWEQETRLLPGVRKTLEEIAQGGIRLSVVANSEVDGETLGERLARMGLRDSLMAVVTSRDLGQTKPAAICYETALMALDLHASQVAFVGHDCEELAGAARLGMQTIAFNFTAEVEADVLMTRFDELIELVDLPGRRSAAG